MSIQKTIELVIIGMITFMFMHLVTRGGPLPRWSDVTSITFIMVGVSPYASNAYSYLIKNISGLFK